MTWLKIAESTSTNVVRFAQSAPWSRLALQERRKNGSARAPNKSLQRSGTHKVLGRGRPNAGNTRVLRARVLKGQRAAAELSR
jgi:hypothetical protein